MIRKIHKTVAFAAVILTVGAVTAVAATSPPTRGVTKNAMNGVNRAAGVNGALKANAVGNRQIKLGSISCDKLSAGLFTLFCQGKLFTGPKGDRGDTGARGATGPTGATGSQGPQGVPGQTVLGAPAPTPDYGVANVLVSRGTTAASIWAQYATPLGSPVGNNTASGVFRFTCAPTKAPCTISVTAAVLGSGDHTIYPRLLVYNAGDGNGQGAPLTTCEYADGSTGAGALTVANQPSTATPTYSSVPLNIGGTADCGNVPAGPAGDVATIVVPQGYYDVHSTFTFS